MNESNERDDETSQNTSEYGDALAKAQYVMENGNDQDRADAEKFGQFISSGRMDTISDEDKQLVMRDLDGMHMRTKEAKDDFTQPERTERVNRKWQEAEDARAKLKYVIDQNGDDKDLASETDEARKYERFFDPAKVRYEDLSDDDASLVMQDVDRMYNSAKNRRGHVEKFWDSLKRGFLDTAAMTAQGWLALKPGEMTDDDLETAKGLKRESDKNRIENPASVESYKDIHGVGDAVDYALSAIGENAYRGAVGTAAAVAGATIGAPVLAAAGMGAGAAAATGGIIGGTAATMLQNTGEAVGDQIEDGVKFSRGLAIAQGFGYSLFDGAFGVAPGVGKMFTAGMKMAGKDVAKTAAARAVKEIGKSSKWANAAWKVGKMALEEGATEATQSGLVGRGRRYLQTGSMLGKNETVVDALNMAADEFLGGAISAVGMGGAPAIANKVNSKQIVDMNRRVVEPVVNTKEFQELSPEYQMLVGKHIMNDAFNATVGVYSADDQNAVQAESRSIDDALEEDASKGNQQAIAARAILNLFNEKAAFPDMKTVVDRAKKEGAIETKIDKDALLSTGREVFDGETGDLYGTEYTVPQSGIRILKTQKDGKDKYTVINSDEFKDPLSGSPVHDSLDGAVKYAQELALYNGEIVRSNDEKMQVINNAYQKMYGNRPVDIIPVYNVNALKKASPELYGKFMNTNSPGGIVSNGDGANDTLVVLVDRVKSLGDLYALLGHERAHADVADYVTKTASAIGKSYDDTKAQLLGGKNVAGAEEAEKERRYAYDQKYSPDENDSAEDAERKRKARVVSAADEMLAERASVADVVKFFRRMNQGAYTVAVNRTLEAVKLKMASDMGLATELITDGDVMRELSFLNDHGYTGKDSGLAVEPGYMRTAGSNGDTEAYKRFASNGQRIKTAKDKAAVQGIVDNANAQPLQLGHDPTQTAHGPINVPENGAQKVRNAENPGAEFRNIVENGPDMSGVNVSENAVPSENDESTSETDVQDEVVRYEEGDRTPLSDLADEARAKEEEDDRKNAEEADERSRKYEEMKKRTAANKTDEKPRLKRNAPNMRHHENADKFAEINRLEDTIMEIDRLEKDGLAGEGALKTRDEARIRIAELKGENTETSTSSADELSVSDSGNEAKQETPKSEKAKKPVEAKKQSVKTARSSQEMTRDQQLEAEAVKNDRKIQNLEAMKRGLVKDGKSTDKVDADIAKRAEEVKAERRQRLAGQQRTEVQEEVSASVQEKKEEKPKGKISKTAVDGFRKSGDVKWLRGELYDANVEDDPAFAKDQMLRAIDLNFDQDGAVPEKPRGKKAKKKTSKKETPAAPAKPVEKPVAKTETKAEAKTAEKPMTRQEAVSILKSAAMKSPAELRKMREVWSRSKSDRAVKTVQAIDTMLGAFNGEPAWVARLSKEDRAEYDSAVKEKDYDTLNILKAKATGNYGLLRGVQFKTEARTTRLAPNGKRSNLTDRQYDQVRTPEFKKWFGDWENDPANASKVLDENGEPLVSYHMSRSGGFYSFDMSKSEVFNYGMHFGTENQARDIVSGYEDPSNTMYEVFLNTRNPIRLEDNFGTPNGRITDEIREVAISRGMDDLAKRLDDAGNRLEDLWEKMGEVDEDEMVRLEKEASDFAGSVISRALKELGYDGVVYSNTFEDGISQDDSWMTASPTAIKSATDNVGTFDANNPDVRFKTGKLVSNDAWASLTAEQQRKAVNALGGQKGFDFVKANRSVRFKTSNVTSEQDTAYLDAVKRGDKKTASRMVREAAKNAGYNVAGWHGSPYKFNTFREDRIIWISEDWAVAGYFADSGDEDSIREVAVKANNPFRVTCVHEPMSWQGTSKEYNDEVSRIARELGLDEDVVRNEISESNKSVISFAAGTLRAPDSHVIQEAAKKKGYDSFEHILDEAEVDKLTDSVAYMLPNEGADYVVKPVRTVAVMDNKLVKSIEAVTYDNNGNVIPLSKRFDTELSDIRFKTGKNERAEYERLLDKNRKDLDKEQVLAELDKIEDRKVRRDAFQWVMRGAVVLPDDVEKIATARKVAEKAKKDPLSYETPQACINDNKSLDRGDDRYIDPDTVPELSQKKDFGNGLVTYVVQDDSAGRRAMRRIMNSHLGKDSNGRFISPWCLLHDDGRGGLSKESEHYWYDVYNKLPKKAAFYNGRIVSFMATSEDPTFDSTISESDMPEIVEEYKRYVSRIEKANEESLELDDMAPIEYPMDFDSYARDRYPSTAEKIETMKIRSARTQERWWDLSDIGIPDEMIPIGNIKIPGDKFGRWGAAVMHKDGTIEYLRYEKRYEAGETDFSRVQFKTVPENVDSDEYKDAVESNTDSMNLSGVQFKTVSSDPNEIGRAVMGYNEGDRKPDLTLVDVVNPRTGRKEKAVRHPGDRPKNYRPSKIAYAYKLMEQWSDGTLHALFAGTEKAIEAGENAPWQYAYGFPSTDRGVKTMKLRERYAWHLGFGLPTAPHLMSTKSYDRGYPSKGSSAGHPKGSRRVWVRIAFDASNNYNALADQSKKGDIYGMIPFGGYYGFIEGNKSNWILSSAVRFDKVLSEDERQQLLKDAGYDEETAWRARHDKEYRKANGLDKKPAKVTRAEKAANLKKLRADIAASIIDNPQVSFKTSVTPEQDAAYMDAVKRGDMETAKNLVNQAAEKAFPIVNVEAGWIDPVNGITDYGKYYRLVEDMKKKGWIGRPIIAWNDDGSHWRAFTGSHRIKAAEEVGIEVPVFEISTESIEKGYDALEGDGRNGDDLISARDDYDRAEMFMEMYENYGIDEFAQAAKLINLEESIDKPVTYDDDGNVIPLSQRFQMDNPDIRFKTANEDSDVKFTDVEDPDAKVGVYIRNGSEKFVDDILSGRKTIETRTKRAWNAMKDVIKPGDRIAVLSGGKVVGYVTFDGVKIYKDANEFYRDEVYHRVPRNSEFAYDDAKGKVGLKLSSPVKLSNPRDINYDGKHIGGRSFRATPPGETGIRFKTDPYQHPRSASDPGVSFAARESFEVHGYEEVKDAIRPTFADHDLDRVAIPIAHDPIRLQKVVDDAMDMKPMTDVDVRAMGVAIAEKVASLIAMRESMNASNGKIRALEESTAEQALERMMTALRKATTNAGAALRQARRGMSVDGLRDLDVFLYASVRSEKAKQGLDTTLTEDEKGFVKRYADELKKFNDRIAQANDEIKKANERAMRLQHDNDILRDSLNARFTMSEDARRKVAERYGHTLSDSGFAALNALGRIVGKKVQFMGASAKDVSNLTQEAREAISQMMVDFDFDSDAVGKLIHDKLGTDGDAMFDQFIKETGSLSGNDANAVKARTKVTRQKSGFEASPSNRKPATADGMKRSIEKSRDRMVETMKDLSDPNEIRKALGRHLRKFRKYIVSTNQDIKPEDVYKAMAEEANKIDPMGNYDATSMLYVLSGQLGFDVATREAISNRVKELNAAIEEAKKGNLVKAAEMAGVEYTAESELLEKLEKKLDKTLQDKARKLEEILANPLPDSSSQVAEIERIRADIADVLSAIKDRNAEQRAADRRERYVQSLRDRLARLRTAMAELEAGRIPDDGKRRRELEIEANEILVDMEEMKKEAGTMRRILRQINELQERIDNEDFEDRPKNRKPDVSQQSLRVQKLMMERDRLRKEFDKRKASYQYRKLSKPVQWWKDFWDIMGESKAIIGSLDLSSMWRQGGQMTWAHPLLFAKNFRRTLRTAFSPDFANQAMIEILSRPNAKYYEKAGIDFTDWGEGADNADDRFLLNKYRLITKNKFVRMGVEASERAFSMYLNMMRADVFDAMVAGSTFGDASKLNDSQLKAIGRFINIASQRGAIDKGSAVGAAIPLLNRIFWSPRNVISRLQFLRETAKLAMPWGDPYGDKTLRRMFAKELVRYLGGMGAMIAFAKMIADFFRDDDEPPQDIDFDPSSSSFMRVKFGNTRVDFMSGLAQILTFSSRIVTGKTVNIRGEERDTKYAEAMGRFMRTKFSPMASMAYDMLTGETFERQELDWTTLWDKDENRESVVRHFVEQFMPLSLQDLYEQADASGVPRTTVTGVMSLLGAGVQAFNPYTYRQLKGDYTAFRTQWRNATDPEERARLELYHPMLKRQGAIEAQLKVCRKLESDIRKMKKANIDTTQMEDWLDKQRQIAVNVMAGVRKPQDTE